MIPGALDRVPLGAMYQMYCLALELERVAGDIKTPTILMHAREDDMSAPRNSERVQRALGGPNELHFLEDSYHMVHVDREHPRVAALTDEFFQRFTVLPALPARSDARMSLQSQPAPHGA